MEILEKLNRPFFVWFCQKFWYAILF